MEVENVGILILFSVICWDFSHENIGFASIGQN